LNGDEESVLALSSSWVNLALQYRKKWPTIPTQILKRNIQRKEKEFFYDKWQNFFLGKGSTIAILSPQYHLK